MQEIEESETLKSQVQTLTLKINDILSSKNLNKEHSVARTSSTQPDSSSNLSGALPMTKQIRLPRLEVPKFSGKCASGRNSGMASRAPYMKTSI